MRNEKLLSETIAFLRFPLIVAVVFAHSNFFEKGLYANGIKYAFEGSGVEIIEYIVRLTYYVLPRITVPVFFLISGFLFFYSIKEFDKATYTKKLSKRVQSLVIPYFLWNFIAIAVKFCLSYSSKSVEIHFTLRRLLNTLFYCDNFNGIFVLVSGPNKPPYPIDVPLWYIRDLFLMVLISPLLYYLIKKIGGSLIIVLGILWYGIKTALNPEIGFIFMFIPSIFFFSWGAYYGINKLNFVEEFRRFKFLPLMWIVLAAADTYFRNVYIHYVENFVGVMAVVQIASLIVESGKVKIPRLLTESSFFIYALHILVLRRFAITLFELLNLPNNNFVLLTAYFVIPLLTISFCVLVYMILNRKAPLLCRLLTGGR